MYRIFRCLIGLQILLLLSCAELSDRIEVVDLECEYLTDPIGIDVKTPRLSWKTLGRANDLRQKSYRILVASDSGKLQENVGDLWDSHIIQSDRSIQISYGGEVLNSREKVYWKVAVWYDDEKTPIWSKISSWEMALLDESDWKARWIGKEELERPEVGQRNPAPYFRNVFMLDTIAEQSRAYISGLGYYELYINGQKVGDHVLSPNQTNYDRRQVKSYRDGQLANMSTRVLYETYDINNYLQPGKNVVAVVLGNGWYYQTTREEYMSLYYDSPRFIAQLELDRADAARHVIVSDTSWKVSDGPILQNNLHHGEIYDARLENIGWNDSGFDENNWKPADVVRPPEGILRAQMSPPDRIVETIDPVSVSRSGDGIYRYDFGRMFSGWVKLHIEGNRGDEVVLTFYEDTGNTYEQSDTYILRGEGEETWEPRFTWHSFRYVEISGARNQLTLDKLEGRVVHSDVGRAGTFESSNTLLNRINEDFVMTQLDNMHGGVPTDCPHRERRGYTGDGQIAAPAAMYNLDMRSFYTKWINDIADAQDKKNGYIPNTAPYHSAGGGTPWGSAYIIVPWYMYLYYGDLALVKAQYPGMLHYLLYLSTQTDDEGLIIENELGEWVPPDPCELPPSFVSSAFYYYDLVLMAKMALSLGKVDDAKTFSQKAELVKNAYNKRYLNERKASYSIGRQGANVFPLAFGLVPEEFEESVFNTLVHHIEVDTKGHFDTGMMGTPYLLEVLTKYGRHDLAYTLMNRRDFPSYGYNIAQGATTLWETWTGKDSHSHPMFGSVCAWFYNGLGGIRPDAARPGFKHIIIRPSIINELDFVRTTYPSVYGDIVSEWQLINGALTLKVTIPPNTTASVFVPGTEIEIDNSLAIFVGADAYLSHYEIPSGSYSFSSKNIGHLLKTPMLSIPVIDPPGATLLSPDSVTITMRQYSRDASIRYTLDGSAPNEQSTLFTKPFVIRKGTEIKAKVFKEGMDPGFTATSKIVFIDSALNGLSYSYFVGQWTQLPEFNILKANDSGKVFTIDLDAFGHLDDKFALLYQGEIQIAREGEYTFYLASNDGSILVIDNQLLIDSDGQHGFKVESGKINLEKGRHKLRLEYFQAGGGKGLELLYEGPGIEKQGITADVLFLKANK